MSQNFVQTGISKDGQTPETRHVEATTWYGLPAGITVSSDDLHRVALPGLTIPHPGIVNMIVRRGLPLETRLDLTARHEFGHLQTLPVVLGHLLFLLWPRRGHPLGPRWLRFVIGLIAHQAAWEVASETYVAVSDQRAYSAPRPVRFKALYAIFWAGMTVLALVSTQFLLKRKT